jgi:arylsulfatase A-like enzyme
MFDYPRAGAFTPTRLILVLFLCLGFSCGQQEQPLNLVLIGVDTLRPDHLGCYGYDRDTSPHIDRLGTKGVVFENVVSSCPWTLPSFATVFTGLYPTQHGAIDTHTPIGGSLSTLAEILKAHGYATGAIINAPLLKGKYAVDQGFDFYYMTPPEGRAADGTTRDALKWIDENSRGPFFMFAHYFDPHIPYGPPAPYDTLFDPQYRGALESPYIPSRLPQYRLRAVNFSEMKKLSPADWNHIRALYDGEIAFTDQAIGELLQGLKKRGLMENSLIVLLSDHGEEFFEHQGFEHGHTLFEELLKVPLIFSLPGRLPENRRIARQVRLVDVEPTILDLLGIDSRIHTEGVSLAPLLEGNGNLPAPEGSLLPPEIAYSEALLYGGQKKSLTAYPWKLIYDVMSGEVAFYNLSEDPGELIDISAQPSHSKDLLRDTMMRTLLNISDTWYLEMAPGLEERRFDFSISCDVVRGAGRFQLHVLMDDQGDFVRADSIGSVNIRPYRIAVENVRTREPLTVAFKLSRPDAPMRFDLWIDDEPTTMRTFLGKSMDQPVTMPFIEQLPQDDPSRLDQPPRRPEPPYFLVWLSRTEYGGQPPVEIDEETEKELRSLGYIQ